MLTMDKIHDIRFRFFVKGENISQIADVLKLDWKTVQKYIDKTDFNEPAPQQASEQRLCPKLDPYKATIDKWLEEDKQAPRKQRHTAKRVFHPVILGGILVALAFLLVQRRRREVVLGAK